MVNDQEGQVGMAQGEELAYLKLVVLTPVLRPNLEFIVEYTYPYYFGHKTGTCAPAHLLALTRRERSSLSPRSKPAILLEPELQTDLPPSPLTISSHRDDLPLHLHAKMRGLHKCTRKAISGAPRGCMA